MDTGDDHSGQWQIILSRVQRADVLGSLSNAIFYPLWDPEFGILSKVLCFLERFSADTLPANWSSGFLSSLQSVKGSGGEKPTLCVRSLEHFFPPKGTLLGCSRGL